jgi:disulfide bond formation protein DsbB
MDSTELSSDSVRLALDIAWREHQHVRDQTWKSVQMVALVAVGLVTVDIRLANPVATIIAGLLLVLFGYLGTKITLHHRAYQIQKFTEIQNCERELHLMPRIVPDTVKPPVPMTFWDAFSPRVGHSAAFLLRMHIALMIFGVLFIIFRLLRAF